MGKSRVRVPDDGALPTVSEPLAEPSVAVSEPATEVEASPRSLEKLNLQDVLGIINQHRALVLTAMLFGLIGGMVITLLTPKMYRADVTLEVNAPNYLVLNAGNGGESPMRSQQDFIVTQVGLLQSRSLAERVAQDLDLASDPAIAGTSGDPATRLRTATAVVAGGLSVDRTRRAEGQTHDGPLIRYTYAARSPELAAKVANSIAEGFISNSRQRRHDASNYASAFLLAQLKITRADLEKSERALVRYAQTESIINTASGNVGSGSSSLQGASLIALNGALANANARRVTAEGAYRQALLTPYSTEVVRSTATFREVRAGLEATYQAKRNSLKPDHPDMVALRSRIAETNRQIGLEQSRVSSAKVSSLLAEYRAAAAAERGLRGQVNELRGSVLDLRGRSIKYTFLQREADTNSYIYAALLDRYKQVGIIGRVGNSPISIVDRAKVPSRPFKPDVWANLFYGLALGFAAGLALALARELFHDTIKSREDVRAKLGLACLGVIPRPRDDGRIIEALDDATSTASEAYASVLAALHFSTDAGAPRALLLTSTLAAEGKSSSALALALNYARRGDTVLLIDADLRRPVFKGNSSGEGLTSLLTSSEAIGAHIVATQYDNLSLLPCGPTPPNPAILLASPRFQAILVEALERFDRVIIDGPPMLGLADATLLAVVTGSVAMVVEAGRTRAADARRALARLRLGGGNVVGAILTKSLEPTSRDNYRFFHAGAVEKSSSDLILAAPKVDH